MAANRAEQPNILLITTDQQRFDASGARCGPSFLRTPHYDDLARNGILLNRAYADCPICVPSRTTIMCGRYARNHGLWCNGPTSTVLDHESTLPAHLRRLGYQTAAIGKMHFGPARARHGFDEMVLPNDYYRQMRESGNPVQPMRHGLGQNELHSGMATVPEALTLTNWTAEQCVNFIHERRDPTMPFFLWCSFSKPHPPLDPPEPYFSMYKNSPIPEPVVGDWASDECCPFAWWLIQQIKDMDRVDPEIVRAARAAYYGLITQIDYNIGRVLAALQDVDLFRDALILYTSDHGEYLGDHRLWGKDSFLESSAHVPMVIRPPQSWGDDLRGTRCEHLVTLADLLPTLVAAAGGEAPTDLDGRDLLATVRGDAAPRECLVGGSLSRDIGITDGRWKYIYLPLGGRDLLFDLQSDPLEAHDRSKDADLQPLRQRLRERLIRELTESEASRPPLSESLRKFMRKWNVNEKPLVVDGDLRSEPVPEMTERQRRIGGWPGYHTDVYGADVCH